MKTTADPPPADEEYGNDAAVEANWAAEAFAFAERHMLLLSSMPSPKDVKLTPYVRLVAWGRGALDGGGGAPLSGCPAGGVARARVGLLAAPVPRLRVRGCKGFAAPGALGWAPAGWPGVIPR